MSRMPSIKAAEVAWRISKFGLAVVLLLSLFFVWVVISFVEFEFVGGGCGFGVVEEGGGADKDVGCSGEVVERGGAGEGAE